MVNEPISAVDGHQHAGGHPARGVVEADDRRDLERAGEDRGVIGAAAGVHREPAHAGPVDLRRDRWSELVGNQDERALDVTQEVAGSGAVPQVHPDAGPRRPRRRPCARADTGLRPRRRPARPPRTPAARPTPR